jgi:hypothetical protein
MHRIRLTLVCSALVLGAVPLAAQTPRDSVLATVNEFFRAMTARDTAATKRVEITDGITYAVRQRPESLVVTRGTNERYLQQLSAMREPYIERIWEPTVLIHGPIAVVWAPYDLHRNRQFVHCGVDAFTLIRTSTGWRIATTTYTIEPTGCKPSPLGPLPPGN